MWFTIKMEHNLFVTQLWSAIVPIDASCLIILRQRPRKITQFFEMERGNKRMTNNAMGFLMMSEVSKR